MTLKVLVLSGSREGQRERFEKPVVTFGRHPQVDFRFAAGEELDVSARHAEVRCEGGGYVLRDTASKNGTYVNGLRIEGAHELHSGDVISFGEAGPRMEVDLGGAGIASRAASMSRTMIATLAAIVLVTAAAVGMIRRERATSGAHALAMARQSDSLTSLYTRTVRGMSRQVRELDSALATERSQNEALRGAIAGPGGGSGSQAPLMEAQSRPAASVTAVDYSAIAELSGPAVALVAVELADGRKVTGTGFSVTREGLVVTNRHVLLDSIDRPPKEVMILFSETRKWLPAHFIRASSVADLGLVQIEVSGPFPTVAGILRSGARTRVGSPVALIGFPLGTSLPMEGKGSTALKASTTVGGGIVSKVLSNLVQVDAYAAEGSSGSPVLDGAGSVLAVVFGGAKESIGRIVYAVPSDHLIPLLPQSATELLR